VTKYHIQKGALIICVLYHERDVCVKPLGTLYVVIGYQQPVGILKCEMVVHTWHMHFAFGNPCSTLTKIAPALTNIIPNAPMVRWMAKDGYCHFEARWGF
jgi:hypothetical protein